ncbi:MAG TPA: hypothetical protein VG273_26400 [Bryobacteraceae bacterium]|jgi:hypothetical protein|nr:hypothetical protein [Bryobacteraceae bacterium]
MGNVSGSTYGLTILSPIIEDNRLDICHSMELRWYLSHVPRDHRSPFAQLSSTYLARLVVMDDVVFVGLPACEEHLKSRYLVFETSFDGDLDTYLRRMGTETREFVGDVWKHCVGFPGTADVDAFIAYMKKCQIETTFFFADVNDRTVEHTLHALRAQSALAHFMEKHQGMPATELQQAFGDFLERLRKAPALPRGGDESRDIPQDRKRHD